MTPSQWAKLKRGDRIRHVDHPNHVYTVLITNSGVVVANILDHATEPAKWLQISDNLEVIDENGAVAALERPECPMCDGAGAAHHDGAMQICPLCVGQGKEPSDLTKEAIRLEVFIPNDERVPSVRFTAETKLQHSQWIELLTKTLDILKAQTVDEFTSGSGPGMLN